MRMTPGNNYYDVGYSLYNKPYIPISKRIMLWIYHVLDSTNLLYNIASKTPHEILDRIINLYSWISLVLFCYKGRYLNWFYRLLKIKTIYTSDAYEAPLSAEIEDINRSFVWKELYQSTISFMETIQMHQIVNTLDSIFNDQRIHNRLLTEKSCSLCEGEVATMPVRDALGKCTHTFCYYCAQLRLQSEGVLICKICNTPIKKIKRIN